MENRSLLLKNLEKVRDAQIKGIASDAKIALGLKKILQKHMETCPSDRPLLAQFLKMGTLAFCDHLLLPSVPKIKKKPTPNVPPPLSKLQDDDSFPSEEELGKHYVAILQSIHHWKADPDILNAYVEKHNPPLDVPAAILHLLALVHHYETAPPVFPLLDRLERLFFRSLVSFLPPDDVVSFLSQQWDGTEKTLLHWEFSNYHQPLETILHDDKDEKSARLRPLLKFWAHVENCDVLRTLTLEDLEEFLRISRHPLYGTRKMNASILLQGIDLRKGRRMQMLEDSEKNAPLSNFFSYWDLSWLEEGGNGVERIIVPMDAMSSRILSEKKFAALYFDRESKYVEDDVFLWAGRLPFRIEFIGRRNGIRRVQQSLEYEQHRQIQKDKGWDVPLDCLPLHEQAVWKTMLESWITQALDSFLGSKQPYDVRTMSRRIARCLFVHKTLAVQLHKAYEIVGRLHPFFPLSRFHGSFRERIHHLYFSLEKLVDLPLCLSFPEYFTYSTDGRRALDQQWESHRQQFQSCLLLQCAQESMRAVGTTTLSMMAGLPLRKTLDHNIHVEDNGQEVSLLETMPRWEKEGYFWDEDIVPGGVSSVGIFVEAPDYYIVREERNQIDLCRFLDSFVTLPSFHPYPCFEEKQIEDEEEEEEVSSENSEAEEDEEEEE